MPEPVNPSEDFRAIRGAGYTVQVRRYDPASDSHGVAQNCFAVAARRRQEMQETDLGPVRVTRRRYQLIGADSGGRPPLKSLILDGPDTWVIDTTHPDPLGQIVGCDTTLSTTTAGRAVVVQPGVGNFHGGPAPGF